MSRPKKDAAKQMAEEATIAYAVAAVEAKPEPDPIVERAVWTDIPAVSTVQVLASVVRPAAPCALEDAPIGAKCVVSRTENGKAVRLLTPAGAETLDTDDIFYTLPAGAKVRKAALDRYEAFRLGEAEGAIFVEATAREAVARYLKVVT